MTDDRPFDHAPRAASPSRARLATLLLGGGLTQRVRLVSGLILFAYALAHFIDHAMGLVGLWAMQAVEDAMMVVVRSPVGTLALGGAAVAHVGVALVEVARKGVLRLGVREGLQLILGLSIPVLLVPHVVDTHVAAALFGLDTSYAAVVTRLWGASGWTQSLLLVIVWTHGCVGIHHWLKLTPGYHRVVPLLAALAVLVPFAALTGFLVAGRTLADALAGAPLGAAAYRADPATLDRLHGLSAGASGAVYGLAALALVTLFGRLAWNARSSEVVIDYVGGPRVRAKYGATLLELSRVNAVPHLSACGGRARCSTCRVRVQCAHPLAEPNEAERRTLRSIGAPHDVRLACQLRPAGHMTVTRLLRPGARAGARAHAAEGEGVDREVAVLFADIRGFTAISEAKLAYDVVFLLNRFFAAMAHAVEVEGGRVDKFIGDGLMCVFDDPRGLKAACEAGFAAAAAMDRALEGVNHELRDELDAPLRLAMGLHAGRLVVGRIGWGAAAATTVVGPIVNVASRLEALAKSQDAQLAVSAATAALAGVATDGYEVSGVAIRGLRRIVEVVLVPSADALMRGQAARGPGEAAPVPERGGKALSSDASSS